MDIYLGYKKIALRYKGTVLFSVTFTFKYNLNAYCMSNYYAEYASIVTSLEFYEKWKGYNKGNL